jgi:hypothetical protein
MLTQDFAVQPKAAVILAGLGPREARLITRRGGSRHRLTVPDTDTVTMTYRLAPIPDVLNARLDRRHPAAAAA